MIKLLILPHQLYNINILKKNITNNHNDNIKDIILWEHPHYFKKYNYNKKKLVLHRASMKYYYDLLKKNDYNVKYLEYDEKFKETDYILFDPIDKINLLKLPNKYTILESPNFLLTKENYKEFNNQRKSKRVIFNNFYLWSKKKLNIYPKLKSMDKMNRDIYNTSEKIPSIPKLGTTDNYYIKEAINYIKKHFPNNYGNTDNFLYPVTHKTAMKWLLHFIKYKFKKFGPYQDFINKDNFTMFHSVLSSSLNIGLINPSDIIKIIDHYKSRVPINSFEGYIRQLFWREYQRYCYGYADINFNKNYFGNKKKLTKDWYKGTLGIDVVDDLIKNGFDTGYMHHIGRLMVIGNFMNISGIHPKEGFRWFMEFSIDSYEWVMHQNVYEMVFFVTGGQTMTRPYISSSNYILKMSNYNKKTNNNVNSNWSIKWDNLYHNFIKKNKAKLYKFRYYFPSL
jgi:deoxyribodipyrimidine photolyase-related protein